MILVYVLAVIGALVAFALLVVLLMMAADWLERPAPPLVVVNRDTGDETEWHGIVPDCLPAFRSIEVIQQEKDAKAAAGYLAEVCHFSREIEA